MSKNQELSLAGKWWIAGNRGQRAGGTLELGSSFLLMTVEELRDASGLRPRDLGTFTINGQSLGQCISMFDCHERWETFHEDDTHHAVFAPTILVGPAHIEDIEAASFDWASFRLQNVDHFANRRVFNAERGDGALDSVSMTRPPPMTAEIPGARLQLARTASATWGGLDRVELRSNEVFFLELDDAVPLDDLLYTYVRPLQQLISLRPPTVSQDPNPRAANIDVSRWCKITSTGRILLPVSSSRTGCPIARSAEELSSTWPSPADITVDLDHRPNWTERIVALRLRPTVGDLSLATAEDCEFTELRVAQHGELADGPSAYSVHQWQKHEAEQRLIIAHNMRFSLDSALGRPAFTLEDLLPRWFAISAKYGPVLDLVFSLRPGIGYLESNVFAIASSLEGIHRKLFQGASKRTATQKERLESICRAAPPEHREWLLRALAHSHEPSFPERIRQLVEHAGEAVAYQLGDLDMWTGLVGKARNNIAHARGLSAADVVGTVRLMQSMQMLAEVILVREIGISKDQCADLIKGDFEWRQVRPELIRSHPELFR